MRESIFKSTFVAFTALNLHEDGMYVDRLSSDFTRI